MTPSARLRIAAAAAAAAAVASIRPAAGDDVPLGPVDPSPQEQFGIYEVNRARANPAAYGVEIGFDLSGVAAAPPLAVNRNLTGSARFHAEEMFHHHYFSHTSAVTGDGPNAMAVQNGYDLFGQGLDRVRGSANTIESNARGVNRYPNSAVVVRDLIIDEGVPGAGHRVHLLALAPHFQEHREIGFGRAEGKDSFPEFGLPRALPTRLYSIHTGYRDEDDLFLTGVVFRDADGDRRYDPGEGLGGVTVSVAGGGTTTSLATGGWSLPIGPGSHLVECSGGAFVGTGRAFVNVAGGNVAVDFHSGRGAGEVGFAWREGIPAGPTVTAGASLDTGPAPLDVTFSGSGLDGGLYAWDFGDGDGATGASAAHRFAAPGLYPAILDGIDSTGAGSSLVVIAAPDGTLPGMPPGGFPLAGLAASLKRKIAVAGKDALKVSATVEVPEGFVPAGATLEVCLGGVRETFLLDAKGKGTGTRPGSKATLKAKWPKDGSGAAAGTSAKATIAMKGAFGREFEAAGLRDRTETRSHSVRLALLLDGSALYAHAATMAMNATAGKGGAATFRAAKE